MTAEFPPPRNLHNALQYNDTTGLVELRTTALATITNAEFTFGGDVSVTNWPDSQTTTLGDSANLSAFSRLRTTNTRLLGEFRTFYGTTGNVEMLNYTAGTASATPDLAEKYTSLSVGTATGDRIVRQSRQYHPYIPGTSQLGLITFCFGSAKPNLFQGAGLYDDSNGVYFCVNGASVSIVERKNGSDSIVDQSLWNVDPMNGLGPSGVELDFTKAQILVIDYQWLGVGRVRVGFDVNGVVYYAHYFNHANVVTEPYNYQPSLPARWELKNTDTTGSSSTMKAICYAVYCEGEDFESGFTNSASTAQTAITVNNAATNYGIVAVRLKNTVNSIPVKAFARLKNWSILSSNDVYYKIVILPGASAISGSPTWTTATSTGWSEYTTGFTLSSDLPANSIVLYEGYAAGSNGNTGANNVFGTERRSAAIYQNYDSSDSMIMAMIAYKINNNNATVHGALNWVEFK